ncbi:UPF0057-domain-containing protein [Cystobasidium minutum MCA 4210]|uniref:UPF0057-domain-containing protein n=1 Tax=Cystobasidium minutum MCA 4210 TaxID=1397322 RepID=UPI0034CD2CDE|eukprot:jgi/Rhomi1/172821/fgenesh1_kg.5_\
MAVNDLILVLICLLFPPAAVLIMSGCSCDLLINICLTILGVIPGHIHGFYLIYRKAKAEEKYGIGNVDYLGNGDYRPRAGFVQQPAAGYGTLN